MKTLKSLKLATLAILTASSIILLTGCKTAPVVISADKECIRLTDGQKGFVPPFNGWFVPDARMLEIVNRLSKAAVVK